MPIPLFRPYFPQATRKTILADMNEIMLSGRLMFGPEQKRLETAFAQGHDLDHSVSVNTCTTALTICLKYFGAENGEILVPSGTFLTSVSSILFAGGTPVLVDMDPNTLSFDLDDLARKKTSNTKGVIWVHLTGVVSKDYEKIIAFCRENNLFLIEDCAHALGSATPDGRTGTLGDAGCYSFYPTKITTSGTGGMIATSNEGLAEYAKQMRIFGKDSQGEIIHFGNDWFLDEFRCCVAYHQFTLLDEILAERQALATRYRKALAEMDGFFMLDHPKGMTFTYYQFPLFLNPKLDHAQLLKNLKANHGIEAKAIYRPTHEETAFKQYDDGTLKQTEIALNRSVCLPLYLGMTDNEFNTVISGLASELKALA